MTGVKNLIINVIAQKSFTSNGEKYIAGQPYYILSEYSDTDPSDLIETVDWVFKMVKKGNFQIQNPKSLLTESKMVDESLYPYMNSLVEYIKNNLL